MKRIWGILQEKFRAEREKTRGMTWRQKFGYIKDYYMASFVVLLFVGVFVVAFVQGFLNKDEENYLNCAVLEYTGVYSALEQAGEEYLAARGLRSQGTDFAREDSTDSEEKVTAAADDLDGGDFVVFDDSDITAKGLETGHDFQKFQGLSAQLSVGDVDIIFMPEEMLLFLQVNREGYFLPLDEMYTREELARLSGHVREIPDENGESYPVAIDVSGWEALEGRTTEGIPLYAAIVAGGAHRERAAKFLWEMSVEG